MKQDFIKMILPMPVSVNHAYRWFFKRKKSWWYISWLNNAFSYIENQELYKIIWNNWLEIEYNFYFPIYNKNWTIKKKDVFNYEKLLSDFLVKVVEWFDDEKILRWRVEKINSDRNVVEVIIREII